MGFYRTKPTNAIFRGDAPGASSCRFCLPFTQDMIGHQTTIPNIAPCASYTGGGGINGNSITTVSLVNGAEWCCDLIGPAIKLWPFSGTPSQKRVYLGRVRDVIKDRTQATFVIHIHKTDSTARNVGMFGNVVPTPWAAYGVYFRAPHSDGNVYFGFGGATPGTSMVWYNPSPNITQAEEDLWVCSVGPRGMEIWRNGKLEASHGNSATLGVLAGTPSSFYLGQGGVGASWATSLHDLCNISYFACYDNQLSQAQILQIYDDPWGTIRRRKFYLVPVHGQKANKLTASKADLDFVGKDGVLVEDSVLTGNEAEMSFAGNNALISAADTLTSDKSELNFSGKDGTLSEESTLTGNEAEMNFASKEADLLEEALISAGYSQIDYLGQDGSLAEESTLTSDKADLNFAGKDGELFSDDTIASLWAELDFATKEADLGEDATLTSENADLNFLGKDGLLGSDDSITANKADLNLVVDDPDLLVDDTLTSTQADLNFVATEDSILVTVLAVIMNATAAIMSWVGVGGTASSSSTVTSGKADLNFQATNDSVLSAAIDVIISAGKAVFRWFTRPSRITTEDDMYYSNKQRIHNAILEKIKAGPWVPVEYEADGSMADLGEDTVEPKTCVLNDVSSNFIPAQNSRDKTSWIADRGKWIWDVRVAFDGEVVADIFEKALTDEPIVLPSDVNNNNLLLVWVDITNAQYKHPTKKQPSSGTSIVYTFEATIRK